MLSAVIYHKADDKGRMCEELDKSLELARRYHYICLLADEGRHFPNYLKSPAEYYESLTTMEKNVFRLMAQGMSNDEIADRLGKKTGTIKFHSNSIFRKLQVQNR